MKTASDVAVEPHIILVENESMMARWLVERGGIAVWGCLDPRRAGQTWSSPALTKDGQPTPKPHWAVTSEPIRIITDPAEVVVETSREVRRFRVAVRVGSQGLTLKLTDASSAKVRRAVEKAGDGAFHQFDYATQEAVIYVPAERRPINLPDDEKGGA